jgi:hypothetical protein
MGELICENGGYVTWKNWMRNTKVVQIWKSFWRAKQSDNDVISLEYLVLSAEDKKMREMKGGHLYK